MSITAGNSVAYIVVENLFPQGFKLEKYGTDAALQLENIQFAETAMSVDGQIIAGKIFNIKPVTVTLAADSPSLKSFEEWISTQEQAREVMWCSMTITIPSTGRTYQYDKGVLQAGNVMPPVNRTLGERTFVLHFESVKMVPTE